jgi:PhnB protein
LKFYPSNTCETENGYKKNDIYFMIIHSLAPWLNLTDGARAAAFYSAAFNAVETYRLEAPDGALILRFSVGGAEFWVSGGPIDQASSGGSAPTMGESIRMILTVPDPDAFFARALAAGAVEVFPVGEGHGWRLGRLIDPFGLHWEIGHPLG